MRLSTTVHSGKHGVSAGAQYPGASKKWVAANATTHLLTPSQRGCYHFLASEHALSEAHMCGTQAFVSSSSAEAELAL